MRSFVPSAILSVLSLILVGWTIAALYDFCLGFSEVLQDPTPPWKVTLDLLPFFVSILFSIFLLILYRRKKKAGEKVSVWLFPLQFPEADEREKMISEEACRKAFISTWYSTPLVACAFVFYPFISDYFRHYPIFLVLFIPFIQIITYFIHIRKI